MAEGVWNRGQGNREGGGDTSGEKKGEMWRSECTRNCQQWTEAYMVSRDSAIGLKRDITRLLAERGLRAPRDINGVPDYGKDVVRMKRATAIAFLCLNDEQVRFINMSSFEEMWRGIDAFYKEKADNVKQQVILLKKLRAFKVEVGDDIKTHIEDVSKTVDELERYGYCMTDNAKGMLLVETITCDDVRNAVIELLSGNINWQSTAEMMRQAFVARQRQGEKYISSPECRRIEMKRQDERATQAGDRRLVEAAGYCCAEQLGSNVKIGYRSEAGGPRENSFDTIVERLGLSNQRYENGTGESFRDIVRRWNHWPPDCEGPRRNPGSVSQGEKVKHDTAKQKEIKQGRGPKLKRERRSDMTMTEYRERLEQEYRELCSDGDNEESDFEDLRDLRLLLF
jgi:hypothetical protein